ncbi:hypothetical protein J4419_00200 [Candidatus Woesearchaeota archaeon]|nr:hypothetical protein [Candidatus Woesearchaeota archaeon]
MAFSKSFPRRVQGQSYPVWEDVFLSEAEERLEESKAREENIRVLKECLHDAREILKDSKLKDFQTNAVQIAIALFEKRASHTVYWKEKKAKEKFDAL